MQWMKILIKDGPQTVKWNSHDIKKYIGAKEYVDTAIIPVQAFQLSNDSQLEGDAFQREVLSVYVNELERELSGRLLLTPTFYFLKTTGLEKEKDRLNDWIQDIQKQPIREVFIFTFDPIWRKLEKDLNCNVLWFPGMKDGDVGTPEAVKLIRNQVKQISELIQAYW